MDDDDAEDWEDEVDKMLNECKLLLATAGLTSNWKGAIRYYPIMWEREKKKISKCYTSSDSSPLAYNDGKTREYTNSYPKSIIEVSNAS